MSCTIQPDIPALYTVVDLQRLCQEQQVKISGETNRYLLYTTLRKIGAVQAQKLIKKLVEKGEIKWEDNETFEVEAILDYMTDDDGKGLYEIKWKGWSMQHNTWEPRSNLECSELLDDFHEIFDKYGKEGIMQQHPFDLGHSTKHSKLRDLMNKLMETREITAAELLKMQSPNKSHIKRLTQRKPNKLVVQNITNKRSKAYRQLKEDQMKRLKEWEANINMINKDPAPVTVENKVDLEGPPHGFVYINASKAMEGIDIPEDPIVGCECTNCMETKKQCCGPNAGAEFAYLRSKRVRVPPGHPIYECNKRCQCTDACPNRVVQLGRKHKVCIFRTDNGRGWGVRALQRIRKGSFVMEYVGEVITFEEAERRGQIYDAEGMTYLFDLDYNDGDCPFTVDARSYGNVSHFVNHSCDPNLAVYGVWINTLDPRLPRIAMFAKKDIDKGEELTFDYMMTGATSESEIMPEKDIEDENSLAESMDPSEADSVTCQQEESKETATEAMDIDSCETQVTKLEVETTNAKPNDTENDKILSQNKDSEMEVTSSQATVISNVSEEAENCPETKMPLQDASVTQSTLESTALSSESKENLPIQTDEVQENIPAKTNESKESITQPRVLKEVSNNIIQEDLAPESSPITQPKFVVIKEKLVADSSIKDMDDFSERNGGSMPSTPVKTPPRVNLSPRKDLTRSGERASFNRRSAHFQPAAMKYRLMCQCGAKNCRKYLY